MDIQKEEKYTGYVKYYANNEELAFFETSSKGGWLPESLQGKLVENQFVLVYPEGEDKVSYRFIFRGGHLEKFGHCSIKNRYLENPIKPKNDEQLAAFALMEDEQTTIKVLTGNYGSGKTMLLVNEAIKLLEHKKISSIVWLRNNIKVEDTESFGALPGTEFEKLLPFLGPMIDHIGNEKDLELMVEKGQLQVPFLGFIRGRNIKNSVIICSEAQNLTMKQIKLIIGRVAEGSQVWFDGDWRQHDGRAFKKARGLQRLIEHLKGNPLFGYVHLDKSERSETARLADLLPDDDD